VDEGGLNRESSTWGGGWDLSQSGSTVTRRADSELVLTSTMVLGLGDQEHADAARSLPASGPANSTSPSPGRGAGGVDVPDGRPTGARRENALLPQACPGEQHKAVRLRSGVTVFAVTGPRPPSAKAGIRWPASSAGRSRRFLGRPGRVSAAAACVDNSCIGGGKPSRQRSGGNCEQRHRPAAG
jgi:hypothetical protein